MEPSKQPLSKLLSIEGTHESYRIPKYQRPYSWGPNQWQQLLDDIEDDSNNVEGHFMGSIICVDVSSGRPGAPRVFELIDGQQRLITLSCLLIAVWSKFNDILSAVSVMDSKTELDEQDIKDLERTMDDVHRKVLRQRRYQSSEKQIPIEELGNDPFFIGRTDRTDYFCRLLPSTQGVNCDDFVHALFEFGLISDLHVTRPSNWGNRRIAKCLRYIFDRLPNNALDLKRLTDRVNTLMFIHISVSNQSDAFRLFESINNRGLPLSALDIIKNAMLAAFERKNSGSIDEAFEKWSSMMTQLGSDTSIHEGYLRHFYNAFQHELTPKLSNKRATRSTVIDIFDHLIKGDAQKLLYTLERRSKYYRAITQPEQSDLNKSRRARLINLSRIDAKPSHQFLLYLLDREDQGKCKPSETNKIIGLVANYFVRRNLTGIPATNRLDAVFIDLIERCEKMLKDDTAPLTFGFVRSALLNPHRGDRLATDEEMEEVLKGHIYWDNPGMARYLLCHFAESRATDEDRVDLWRRTDTGRYVWTIEHVLPQGAPLKADWIDMLANGDEILAAEIQAEYKDKLGNLTLSAYNSNLSDAPFILKQRKTKITLAGETAYIGYLNGTALNALPYRLNGRKLSLATSKQWNEKHITARGETLISAILKAFPL